jgi:diaminopimelate decarboxylase
MIALNAKPQEEIIMQHFYYRDHELYAEQVKLSSVATQFGTPCYVYSRAAIEKNWQTFDKALSSIPHQICYAVKANSNIAILNLLARLNSGFDIVSLGELERVIAAKGDPKKIIFSGVGKQENEISRALEYGIHCFNVESEDEITRINSLAEKNHSIANIALRINPNIDAETHPYIATGLKENKFGIDVARVAYVCKKIKTLRHIKLIGIACHIGSQLTKISPFLSAIDQLLKLVTQVQGLGFVLEHVNIGGGLGIRYQDEKPPSIDNYIHAICQRFANCSLHIIIEPGRAIMGDAGILLTRIEYLKQTTDKNFAIVDAAMNDLIRPALYNAWQEIIPVNLHQHQKEYTYDIVGPICESADFLGKDRHLAIRVGDLLTICTVGAYGFSMCSNYNSRPRVAEVMIDKDVAHLIRRRETIQELFSGENLLN